MRKQSTLAGRLIWFSVAYASLAVIVTSLVLWFVIAGVVREQVDQRLDLQIETIRNAIVIGADGGVGLRGSVDGPPFDRQGSGWYWQVEAKRQRLSSRSLGSETIESPPSPFDWRRLLTGTSQAADGGDGRGGDLHFRVARAFVGGTGLEIVASAPSSALSVPSKRALVFLVPAMLILGACLIIGSVLQVRFGLSPLRRLSGQIAEIATAQRSALPPAQAAELLPIVEEINHLVEANKLRLAQTRLQFANLAHGLKTPVASLGLALNDDNDPSGASRALVARIDRNIRHHLGRTRSSFADAGHYFSIELAPRIDDILEMMSRIYADRKIVIRNSVSSGTFLNCSPEDADEIFAGIIDNAFKWAASEVQISSTIEQDNVAVVIADDGPGIEEAFIGDVLFPGRRLDESKPGDGFGLTIAAELAEMYGGSVELAVRQSHGLVVTIRLPVAMR